MKKIGRVLLIVSIMLVAETGVHITKTNYLKSANEKLAATEDKIEKSKEEINNLDKNLKSIPDVDSLSEAEKSKLLKNSGNKESVIEQYRVVFEKLKADREQEESKVEQLNKEYDELISNIKNSEKSINFNKAIIKLNVVAIVLILCLMFFRKREKQES